MQLLSNFGNPPGEYGLVKPRELLMTRGHKLKHDANSWPPTSESESTSSLVAALSISNNKLTLADWLIARSSRTVPSGSMKVPFPTRSPGKSSTMLADAGSEPLFRPLGSATTPIRCGGFA